MPGKQNSSKTEMLYFPLLAADALDLTEPFFNMYVRQLPNCEQAARQRWGVAGAYFPETTSFDGPTLLPDDVAAEFQDVLLGRKPHTAMSPRAKTLCQFDSQLNVVAEPYKGRFSWISHVASSASELAIPCMCFLEKNAWANHVAQRCGDPPTITPSSPERSCWHT